MVWSQLKRRIEANFAPSLRGRLEIHAAQYRRAHDDHGRIWITLDGQEIENFDYYGVWKYATDDRDLFGSAHAVGRFHVDTAWHAAHEMPGRSIDEALTHECALVRALAILDRRVGKRRLRSLKMSEANPIVRRFFEIRCIAEGMDIAANNPS